MKLNRLKPKNKVTLERRHESIFEEKTLADKVAREQRQRKQARMNELVRASFSKWKKTSLIDPMWDSDMGGRITRNFQLGVPAAMTSLKLGFVLMKNVTNVS